MEEEEDVAVTQVAPPTPPPARGTSEHGEVQDESGLNCVDPGLSSGSFVAVVIDNAAIAVAAVEAVISPLDVQVTDEVSRDKSTPSDLASFCSLFTSQKPSGRIKLPLLRKKSRIKRNSCPSRSMK